MEKEKKVKVGSIIINIIISICLIIIVGFVLDTIIETIMISNITELSKKSEGFNNYSMKMSTYSNGTLCITKAYCKDSKLLRKIDIYGKNINTERKITIYDEENSSLTLIQSGNDKVAVQSKKYYDESPTLIYGFFNNAGLIEKINYALTCDVQEKDNTYILRQGENFEIWIDKQTGLIVKESYQNQVSDREYEFNTVTDEDVAKPDITGYKLQENN